MKHINIVAEVKAVDQVVNDDYAIYQGDACELIRAIPPNSIHLSVFSPPFESLYKFSAFDRDISNNDDVEGFFEHFKFLIRELLRITKPGRLCCTHVMQLPRGKGRDGFIGMRDFRGEVVRAYEECGWYFHSEVMIRKSPVVAQQRTKSIRLLHAQITKDSCLSGQALADYVVMFRKPGENSEPVSGMFDDYIGTELDLSREAYERDAASIRVAGREPWPYDRWVSIFIWQKYAESVWMDIDQTRTLQYRTGRDPKDEAHIAPLQLDVIERCIDLWSNPGDVVLTPFMGIGSEVFSAVRMGRKGVGFELKPSYYAQAVINLLDAKPKECGDLFDQLSADHSAAARA
jgi:DNA modification methylase